MFRKLFTLTTFALLTFSAAQAQSTVSLQAHVPFEFKVRDQSFAAGNYRLQYGNSPRAFSIWSTDRGSGLRYFLARPAKGSQSAGVPGKLIFHCHATTCYLAEIWQAGDYGGSGFQLPRTEAERQISYSTRALLVPVPEK